MSCVTQYLELTVMAATMSAEAFMVLLCGVTAVSDYTQDWCNIQMQSDTRSGAEQLKSTKAAYSIELCTCA